MATDPLVPYASLRREVAERLCSFFMPAGDGRATSSDSGAAVASSQGPHRERNEDRSAIVRFRFGSVRTDLRLGILCDGMGGMAKGGEAASLAIGSFIAAFATIETDCPLNERLERSCLYANRAVFNTHRGDAGTTLTAIAFANLAKYAVHVGDSRLYGIDNERMIDLLSQDDTVSGAVNAHLGQDSEDEMDNRLLQFVGIGDAISPHIIDIRHDNEHDLWLLTSDGAHSVGRKALSGICEGSRNPYDLVRKLVYVSEAINTQDNATALCIRSGHIRAIDDEHEGLTLQITTPDKSLEIWLPPSALQIATTAASARREGIDAPSANADPVLPENKHKPLAGTKRQSAAARRQRLLKENRPANAAKQTPMNLIFDVSEDDN